MGPLLWLRAGFLGAAVLLTGAVSHAAADGRLPGLGAMALLLVATTLLASFLLRRRASVPRLVLLVVGGQTLVHTLLSAMAGHHGDSAATSVPAAQATAGAPHAHHLAHQPALVDDAGRRVGSLEDHFAAQLAEQVGPLPEPSGPAISLGWLGHLVEHVVDQPPLMLLAHTLAAVAIGVWLGLGEAAVWTLVELAALRLVHDLTAVTGLARAHRARLSVLAALSPVRRRLLARTRIRLPRPAPVRHVICHRGPPALLPA
ncbi:hypothetical protein [Nocardioides pacificus]